MIGGNLPVMWTSATKSSLWRRHSFQAATSLLPVYKHSSTGRYEGAIPLVYCSGQKNKTELTDLVLALFATKAALKALWCLFCALLENMCKENPASRQICFSKGLRRNNQIKSFVVSSGTITCSAGTIRVKCKKNSKMIVRGTTPQTWLSPIDVGVCSQQSDLTLSFLICFLVYEIEFKIDKDTPHYLVQRF